MMQAHSVNLAHQETISLNWKIIDIRETTSQGWMIGKYIGMRMVKKRPVRVLV